MKKTNLNLLATVLLSTFTALAFASSTPMHKFDSTSCLLLEGRILNAADRTDENCVIELIQSGGGIDTIELKGNRRNFKFFLKRNTYYALRISKSGYITRLVSINTEVAENSDWIYKFSFQTSLIETDELSSLNADALDFPIAIIHYDKKHDDFSYNKEYSDQIRRETRTVKPNTQIASN